jgi:threonylcarbamoyladenosine tRNA methylthiotransferase MtaB
LNPAAKIIVTGCYVERDAEAIRKICPDALILRNREKDVIARRLTKSADEAISEEIASLTSFARNDGVSGISSFANHNRAFVKIQDGCDNHCSYCKVPLVRGAARNRDAASILREAGQLADNGFKEIVLCGICLGAYKDLTGLIDSLEEIEALKRIRLSSIEPMYVSMDLIDRIYSSQKLCRHLHIPLQSGDDKILKAMNRNYTRSSYISLIEAIRKKIPEIAITTDVLVGFPGETDTEFKKTLNALKIIKPMRTHIFTFSKREGTEAFYMPAQVDKKEKTSRSQMLKKAAQELSFSYIKTFEGQTVEVLVENAVDRKTGLLTGYTDTYIRVSFEGSQDLANELVKVRITKVLPETTIGRVI